MSPERKEIFKLLHSFFGSDLIGRLKALTWYHSNNPLLGGISPKHMVQAGKQDRLMRFIKQQLEDSP